MSVLLRIESVRETTNEEKERYSMKYCIGQVQIDGDTDQPIGDVWYAYVDRKFVVGQVFTQEDEETKDDGNWEEVKK